MSTSNVSSAHVDQAASVVSGALLRNPKIDWVLPENADVFGNPVYSGLTSARATTKVKIGGPSGGVGGLLNVKQGHLAFAVAAAGNLAGWNAADGLCRMIGGDSVPTNYPFVTRLFDSSNITTIKQTPAEGATYDWFGTPTYQAPYLKAWKVS
ncbi:hypothetical protein [uncultured Jatrophihabitans sp.]|uniref:hypothetical protein n=1 Tax=uncultured Jatrophihabitans sp. TaxID=1610747 RepID=UPI0035C94FA6